MFFRARRALNRAWFDFNCRGLFRTVPLPAPDLSAGARALTVVTMLPHGELSMYLLALTSFVSRLGRVPRVVILNDGSLQAGDLRTLQAQVPSAEVVAISAVSTGSCPRGSCWERLMLISDLSQTSYVVQLDADTLTAGPIPEVVASIAENRSFTLLGDRSYPEVEPMVDACARLKRSTSGQVQAVCERSFDQLPEAATLKYLRGNAGFVGFAQGSLTRERITWFSDLMRRLAGPQWEQWGSEQLTSNLLIANMEQPLPLPAPRYVSHWAHPEVRYEDSSFVHFIGPFRYAHGLYRRTARRVLAGMVQGGKFVLPEVR